MTVHESFDTFVVALRELLFVLRATSDGAISDLGCTMVERSVLDELGRGEQTVPDLAFPRAVSRQAMQKTIDRLLDRRLVKARSNPRHQRSPLLELTPAGERLLAEIHRRERLLVAGTTFPLSGAELQRATAALRTLQRHFTGLGAGKPRAAGSRA
jgi:DNA-binding MarR family transcriptional regulator